MLSMLSVMRKDRKYGLSDVHAVVMMAAVFVLFPCVSNAFDLKMMQRDVEAFMKAVHETQTLNEYYFFEGETRELELEFELDVCRESGVGAFSEKCVSYTRCRWEQRDKVGSYYLHGLARVVPHGPIGDISIDKGPEGSLPHLMVHVKIGNHTLSFLRPIRANDIIAFGRLHLSKIDGNNVGLFVSDRGLSSFQDDCEAFLAR